MAGLSLRRVQVRLAIVVVALLASACTIGASSGAPTTASPSPSAPSPSATPTVVDDTLVARIFVYPDVTAGRVPPLLSVYADGRVLSPSWNADGGFALPFVLRRLTPGGLAELRAGLASSGFFAGDIELPPTQVTNSGYTTYAVSLRLGDVLVTARTTNFAMSARGRALVDLAEGWVHPERELPAAAWASGPSAYEGSHWYVALRLQPGAPSGADADSTALESVVGDLVTFGRLRGTATDGSVNRCASVAAAVVVRIVAALAARGVAPGPGDGKYLVDLRWSGGRGSVALAAYEMLPDDPPECPVDVGA